MCADDFYGMAQHFVGGIKVENKNIDFTLIYKQHHQQNCVWRQ
jgi:hypothetical protein